MTATSAALLAGGGAGAGVLLVVAGLRPAPLTLAEQLRRLDTPAPAPTPSAATSSVAPREAASLLGRLTAVARSRGWGTGPGTRLASDLAVTRSDPARLRATQLIGAAVAGLALLLPAAAGVALVGGGPWLVPVWLAVAAAALGWVAPELALRREAGGRRRAVRSALSAYLDLVAMRMASGAALAEALADAALIGDGPVFAALRRALADARTDGDTPAGALRRLGQRLAVPELADAGRRLALVEGAGAQAAASLQAQAAGLRDRELAEVRGQAAERSQSMVVAQVVLGLGFLVFLGYPALAAVLAS